MIRKLVAPIFWMPLSRLAMGILLFAHHGTAGVDG